MATCLAGRCAPAGRGPRGGACTHLRGAGAVARPAPAPPGRPAPWPRPTLCLPLACAFTCCCGAAGGAALGFASVCQFQLLIPHCPASVGFFPPPAAQARP